MWMKYLLWIHGDDEDISWMNLSLSKDSDQAPYIDESVKMSLPSLHVAFCDHFIKEKASTWVL